MSAPIPTSTDHTDRAHARNATIVKERPMINDLTSLLTDRDRTWTTRRTRLQGWRGGDAHQADDAARVQRLAPALCAAGAFAGAISGSWVLFALLAASSVAGALAANHPFEVVYNHWAAGHARPILPANRAAKRLACVMGIAFFGAAAVAAFLGASTVALVLGLVFGVTATFVATTGICVPSVLFSVLWGVERATAPSLFAAARASRGPTTPPRVPA